MELNSFSMMRSEAHSIDPGRPSPAVVDSAFLSSLIHSRPVQSYTGLSSRRKAEVNGYDMRCPHV